ncbi:MAG: hypothetical protein ACTSP5_10045 [Candidatus Heimdallarchaeota archaeon]
MEKSKLLALAGSSGGTDINGGKKSGSAELSRSKTDGERATTNFGS